MGEFAVCFYIQGSFSSKEAYYVRTGIFIIALPITPICIHRTTEIEHTTPEKKTCNFEKQCEKWIGKAFIKKILLAFMMQETIPPLKNAEQSLWSTKWTLLLQRNIFLYTKIQSSEF